MTDLELIDTFAKQLEAAMLASTWRDANGDPYPVIQLQQPTQEGADTGPRVYFQKLFDYGYGWPQPVREHVAPVAPATQGSFITYEKQWTETTFQVTALVIQDPNNLALPTPSDVVNYLKQYINSGLSRAALKPVGVSVLRIINIRNPYYEDDRDTFQANPNFDAIAQHQRTFNYSVPGTNIVQGRVVDKVAGAGLFPVPDNPPDLTA